VPEEPPAPPRPFPAPEGAPELVRALAPLAAVLREAAGAEPADIPVGAHTALDALPYEDASLPAVTSVLGVALTPRPRRAGHELLRVVRPGGLIALAVPTPSTLVARTLKMAGLSGPSPLRWGDEEALAERLPGASVELRPHVLRLGFESVEASWQAVAVPFGVPRSRYDRFADMLAAYSPGAGELGMQDHWQVVLARTPS
jgi:SAM-dependent methyltransferase